MNLNLIVTLKNGDSIEITYAWLVIWVNDALENSAFSREELQALLNEIDKLQRVAEKVSNDKNDKNEAFYFFCFLLHVFSPTNETLSDDVKKSFRKALKSRDLKINLNNRDSVITYDDLVTACEKTQERAEKYARIALVGAFVGALSVVVPLMIFVSPFALFALPALFLIIIVIGACSYPSEKTWLKKYKSAEKAVVEETVVPQPSDVLSSGRGPEVVARPSGVDANNSEAQHDFLFVLPPAGTESEVNTTASTPPAALNSCINGEAQTAAPQEPAESQEKPGLG